MPVRVFPCISFPSGNDGVQHGASLFVYVCLCWNTDQRSFISPSTHFSPTFPPVLGVPVSSESDIRRYSSYKLLHLSIFSLIMDMKLHRPGVGTLQQRCLRGLGTRCSELTQIKIGLGLALGLVLGLVLGLGLGLGFGFGFELGFGLRSGSGLGLGSGLLL